MIVVQCIFGRWTCSLRLSGNIVLSSIILLRKYCILFSHQIDDLKSISAPNNGQQELLPSYLLLDLFTDIIARHMQFRRMMKFQSKPTLVPSYNPSNMLFSWPRESVIALGKFPLETVFDCPSIGVRSEVNRSFYPRDSRKRLNTVQ
jgi:hypothetical protein